MKKISFIVIFAMVLSLLMQFSVTVSAAGGEGDASTINVNDTLVMPTNVNYNAGVFTINSNAVSPITVTGTGSNTIAVAGGVSGLTLILNDVSITSPSGGSSPINLQSNANVTIQLTDGTSNLLDANGANNVAGLCVPSTATVAINGTGSLTVTGGNWGAGIGGGSGAAGGTINISSGAVAATGGQRAAGIGGGNNSAGGTISISGGTVTAAGGQNGAGIGGGRTGAGGTVNISGGTVTATGGQSGAGIGSGLLGAGGIVNITGTPTVMAASDSSNPAIYAASGSGSVINATLNNAISTNPTYLKCNGNELTLPGNYKNFAFSAAANSAVNAYSDPTYSTLLGIIMTNPAGVTSIPVTSPSVVTPVMINIATITVKKDNSTWTAGTPTMQLSTSSTALQGVITGTSSNGVYTFTGLDPATTYYVWDAIYYTNQSVIITSSNNAIVNYYTVQFAVTDAGTASGSTKSATYNSVAISSGDVVLGGKQLVITAVGQGASSYTYAWSGTGTSGQTTATLTIASLSAGVTATCTVTGAPASTTINVGDSSGSNLPTGVTYAGNLFTIGTGANNSTITVTGTTVTNSIAIAPGVSNLTLILNGVSITSPSGGKSPIDLQGTANVTIQLADGTTNTLNASAAVNKAGLSTYGTATVAINGTTGELNATGGQNGSGIGGANGVGGNITINGGKIAATGGMYGAGIGGAGLVGGDSGNITINGGTVTASGKVSAGIGSGAHGVVKTISITGGTITAKCTSTSGAGIGGGNTNGIGGNISISGGTVSAFGDWSGAGIGGGIEGDAVNISVSGGTVTAIGGANGGAGIGSGMAGVSGTISIGSSTSVMAASTGSFKLAIDVTSVSSGNIINARLNNPISATVDSFLNWNENVLKLPANYEDFAFSSTAAAAVNAYSDLGCTSFLGSIVTDPAGTSTIPVTDLSANPTGVTAVKIYAATVTVNKDGAAYSSGAPTMKLSTSSASLTGAVTGTLLNNIYTFTGLDAAVTYYVWDTTNNQYTGQSVTSTSTNAIINYYSLTANLNGGNGTTANGIYLSGKVVSIDAGTKTDYAFNGWTRTGGGTFGTASSAATTFTMPASAVNITANWTPVLAGTVNLSVDASTGQVTASASGGNTGTTGALTYTWSGGATGTGTTATPTLGMPTTCTLTAAGASGSINASITVYKVTVTKSGNTGTDNVSIANAYGKAGDSISLAYTLDSTGTLSNTLTYSGAASNPAAVSAPGSGTSSYTIASGDASSGIVALTATFSHLNIPTYALTIIGGGTGVSGAGSYTSGSVVPIDAGTKSGYIFSGWTTSGGGTFGTASSAATTFTMPASAATITANWTLSSSGGGSGGSGGGTATLTPTHVPVIVDGKDYFIGDVAVEDNTATITVNQSEFDKQLAAAEQSVIVPVSSDAGTVVAQLVVKNVQDMNDKGVPLSIQTGNINYNIPASSIDTKAILTALGATDPSLAPVNLTIRINVDSATQAIVDAAISTTSVKEIIPAVQFEVSANYNGKTYDIVNFDNFVSRSVEITQEQAQQITTAIVINPDRTIRHVPTFVYQKDGKWYAQINSRTNSTYVLIYNQMSFSDADGKWYQPVVNEMGSRKIISGVSNNCFAGEKAITRAEFAAILVRALGLPASGTATFSDVSANAWYSGAVATAAQYGIVGGVGHNKFAPNDKITREQAMQMIYNASRLTPYAAVTGTDNTRSFTDYGTQSVWATDAVIFNINNGFIQGYNGLFNPKSNITRAETATVVLKLLQKSGLVDVRTKL